MRTKRLAVICKLLLVCMMAVSLGFMGGTYAVWTDSVTVAGNLTTGVFDMLFQDQEPTVHLVDDSGCIIEIPDISMRYDLVDGKKRVRIFLEGSLPAELLEENYIRIQFSMEKDQNSTFADPGNREADFQSPEFQVSMKAKSVSVVADGNLYERAYLPEEYEEPLVFNVFREILREEEQLNGSLYLGLTEESRSLVAQLTESPPSVEVNLEEPGRKTGQGDWGILAEYECEIPFYLDQRGADSKHQEWEVE